MDRTCGDAMALAPGRISQPLQPAGIGAMQTIEWPLHKGAAGGLQKRLLIHRLVGAAGFEALRSISADEQQRQGAEIGFHRRWQQVGHGRARSGDHRGGATIGATHAQRQESGGALINAAEQLQAVAFQA